MFFKKKKAGGLSNDAQLFIKQSLNGAADIQAINNATWHMDQLENWSVDMEKGLITFTFPEKVVDAKVQIVGTLYNGEFMWGWDHPSVPTPLAKTALLVKKWGEENNISSYTQKLIPASETDAWEFTAVAARLGKATGVYRGQSGPSWIYMTFGTITMKKR